MSRREARGTNVPEIVTNSVTVDHEAVGVEIEVNNFSNRQDVIWNEYFTGISKCDPVDKFDPQLGVELAYWRAVERAAKKNLDRLNGLIKHRDDLRDAKNITNILDISIGERYNKIYVDGKETIFFSNNIELVEPYAVTFKTTNRLFSGKTGYVIGELDFGGFVVYHPDIEWSNSGFVTQWPSYTLKRA